VTPDEPVLLNIFVYGTLKRGQRNHERFCRRALATREATVRGWLYELPYGYPALVVPEEEVWVTGTRDYLSDAQEQHRATPRSEASSLRPTVYGEVLTFDDTAERLPLIDGLEGFRPGEESLYERVLVPATLLNTSTVVMVWTYAVESAVGLYLPAGRWPP
jgi:gamma-glutamylcyclotransferase (GGCT)/AIG2-like uncharacterized protein YtfP